MGRQIHFFLCDSMRASIEREAERRGARLVSHSACGTAIEFSYREGEGRLWTETPDSSEYDALCREVKKDASYDRESGLWVKRESQAKFAAYKSAKAEALAQLVEKNRKYAIDVLGGRPISDKKSG